MSQPEFLAWAAFHRLFPIDDLHRIHRPAALIAASMGGDIDQRLEWLQPEPPVPGRLSAADLNSLKALGIKPQAH